MPHKQENPFVRSETRVRESVRCLPKGHFQQIRQMFDRKTASAQNLSIVHEMKVKSSRPLKLPSTEEEKSQHSTTSTNIDDVRIENGPSMGECGSARLRRDRNLPTGKSKVLAATQSCPSDTLSSVPHPIVEHEKPRAVLNQHRLSAMASAMNYTDSYQSSPTDHFNRIGSTRQYAASLQRTLAVHAKPILVKTTCGILKQNAVCNEHPLNPALQTSKRLLSSTSLSSTGYDSNSSPSIVSKRNSLATTHSIDLSSSSSDDRQRMKSWLLDESGIATLGNIATSFSSEDIFDCGPESSSLGTNRTRNTSPLSVLGSVAVDSPAKSIAKYSVQTTSFPEENVTDIPATRDETPVLRRKHPLGSTGFAIAQRSSTFSPIVVQKVVRDHDEMHSSAPRKPPRTFEHESRYATISKTNDLGERSNSCADLTAGVALVTNAFLLVEHERARIQHRSSTLPDYTKQTLHNENIYEELKTPSAPVDKGHAPHFSFDHQLPGTVRNSFVPRESPRKKTTHQSMTAPRSPMKKVVSEPNLAKIDCGKVPSAPFFSPRGLLDRFKRILPVYSSKQSLNEGSIVSQPNTSVVTVESDDSTSSSSDNNDEIRTSRLDHVSRVKTIYDTLGNVNPLLSLCTDVGSLAVDEQSHTLYDYVVHLLPEQELGYFANGTGCLSSSNLDLHYSSSPTGSLRFKYPFDAKNEPTLKYFCFPDYHDSNNNNNNHEINPFTAKQKTSPDYFRFTLTDMHGRRQHGYCSRFIRRGVCNALCVISRYDMIEFYQKILFTATELFVSYNDDDARKFLVELYPHRPPNRGDTIYIPTSTVGLYTLTCEHDRRKQLIDSVTLLKLSTDNIIKIFSAILYEQKLIFIGNDLGPLTRLINTFLCLLYPFSWPHTYVPVLPALMLDIIQAPTPYIIGILRSCEHYLAENKDLLMQDTSDLLIVDIDNDRLRTINDYITNDFARGSVDNLNLLAASSTLQQPKPIQILPKLFKLDLKQELTLLKKSRFSLSLDECQQRLRHVFMSIFVQSCYNYSEYLQQTFDYERFIPSKTRTIEVFLEWFTRTQVFQLFIRQKLDRKTGHQQAVTFDVACQAYRQTLSKSAMQRITAKSVKRKAASRTHKQDVHL